MKNFLKFIDTRFMQQIFIHNKCLLIPQISIENVQNKHERNKLE